MDVAGFDRECWRYRLRVSPLHRSSAWRAWSKIGQVELHA
jgi:hypothetical protein